jgi:hypothetical protein
MEEDIMDFEEYCAEVLDIPNCDFLSKKEWDEYYSRYIDYLDRIFERETGRCSHCGNYMSECGCDR